MSAHHTPGPWHWVNSQTDKPFDFDAEWDGEGRPSLRTVAEHKQHETSIWTLPVWIIDAEPMQYGNDAANARLIAAAPELLAALQAEEEWRAREVDGALDPDWDYEEMVSSKRRAAIAKATGEQS